MTDYYVANDGDDSKDGQSIANRWKTMAKVNTIMGSFNAGDNIYFNRGDSWNDAILYIEVAGSDGSPITFGAYGSGVKPIFNHADEGIRMWENGSHWIVLQDLHLKDNNGGGAKGIQIYGKFTDLVIQRVDIEDPAHNGIDIEYTDTFTIQDCNIWESLGGIVMGGTASDTITNGKILNNTIYRTTENNTDGIYFYPDGAAVGPNFLIEGNTIYGWGEEGIDITSGSNIIIRNNEIYDNTRGITCDEDPTGIFIDENYIHDNGRNIYCDDGLQVRLRRNKIRDGTARFAQLHGDDFWVLHNTFYDNDTDCATGTLNIWDGVSNVYARNNIFVSPNNANPTRFINDVDSATRVFDYNYYYRNDNDDTQILWDGLNWADWQSEPQDANGAFDDPELIDPTNGNFHLGSSSPCINTGGWIATIVSASDTATSFDVDTNEGDWFCDGFGVGTGDSIQVEGTTTAVTITDVSGDTITVDQNVTWTQNDGLAFAFYSSAPDVGAEQYGVPTRAKIKAGVSMKSLSGATIKILGD